MHHLPELKSLYTTLHWHETQRDKKPGESVGIFATLPIDIAQQFPAEGKLGEDSSPAHITVCYIGDVPLHFEEKVEKVVKDVCSLVRPFTVKLGRPKKFVNDKNQTIIHSPVKSKKLHDFHDALKYALLRNLIPISNKHPEFKPHVTIEYVNEGEQPKYSELKPFGEWKLREVWIWGTKNPYLIPLGK